MAGFCVPKKMKKFVFVVLSALLLSGMLFAAPSQTFAQCGNPSTPPCTPVNCDYTAYSDIINYAGDVIGHTSYIVNRTCCRIFTSYGSCTCCMGGLCLASCSTIPNPNPNPNPTTGPYCGDLTCDAGETCNNCFGDCGVCPTGNVQVRAMTIPNTTTQCTDVVASTAYIAEDVTLFPVGTLKQTSAVAPGWATWNNLELGTYGFADAPGDYLLKFACSTKTGGAPYTNSGSANLGANETIQWNLGYTAGSAWWQAQGGDIYGATNLKSYVPSGTAPRRLVTNGLGGSGGVVNYGTSYDFAASAQSLGEGYVSGTGWLANEAYAGTDYYAVMYHRFGSPDPEFNGETTMTAKPATGIHYVNGNLSVTTQDWSIIPGESIVVLVNGNLTINRKINLTGTGFVSFIVNGNITVDPTVGGLYSSSLPALEGVYITSPAGVFSTGTSTNVGTERLVGKGIFVVGDTLMQRDLDSVTRNMTTSSELFIYNPQLLLTMPEEMKDLPVSWQEVAP
jgi:hypothetical protein